MLVLFPFCLYKSNVHASMLKLLEILYSILTF